jgi:hypothetical protein
VQFALILLFANSNNSACTAFSWSSPSLLRHQPFSSFRLSPHEAITFTFTALKAKPSRSAKGFGKQGAPKVADSSTQQQQQQQQQQTMMNKDKDSNRPSLFQSIQGENSSLIPTIGDLDSQSSSLLPPEERAKQILREQYGLKTLEEQQLNAKQLENFKEQQKKMAEWRQKEELKNDIDFMQRIPGPVQMAISGFLKGGLAVTSLLFVASGLAMTLEAWSKTTTMNTGNTPSSSGFVLPENVDAFIVQTIEPNFTNGLFVLLGFSVSLGLFSMAQMTSADAQYKEK